MATKKVEKRVILNPKHERFCQEYTIDLNGTKAAKRAGYSPKTANEQASRLLANVNIKHRIAELQFEIKERNKLTADDVIAEFRALAYWDIKSFLKKDNTVKDISKVKTQVAKPVIGIKSRKTVTQTIVNGITTIVTTTDTDLKLSDKENSLIQLARHFGVYEKDNEQVVPNGYFEFIKKLQKK